MFEDTIAILASAAPYLGAAAATFLTHHIASVWAEVRTRRLTQEYQSC